MKGDAPEAFENEPARVPTNLLDERKETRSSVPKASLERKRKSKSLRRDKRLENVVDQENRVDPENGADLGNGEAQL